MTFRNKKQSVDIVRLNNKIEKLQTHIDSTSVATSKSVTGYYISNESISHEGEMLVDKSYKNLYTSLESISDINFKDEFDIQRHKVSLQAGALGGLLATNYSEYIAKTTNIPTLTPSTEAFSCTISSHVHDSVSTRTHSLESYDDRNNRTAMVYSMAWNQAATMQDEFSETLWPTLVITNDNVGFGITVNLLLVFDKVTRNISGDVTNYFKKNVIRSVADYTILRKDVNTVIPWFRPVAISKFINPAYVPVTTIDHEGTLIPTAPLAVRKKIDLLGLSQTDDMLQSGANINTDTLDPTVSVKAIYLKVGSDIIKINTKNLPYNNFIAAQQNNIFLQYLNFDTTSVVLDSKTKRVDGSPLVDLSTLDTNNLTVRVEVKMNGSVNIETAEIQVYPSYVAAYKVYNADKDSLADTDALAAPIFSLLSTAEIVGWDVLAYRTNMNRRQQGQFIDISSYTQMYNVPMRSPITAIRPAVSNDTTDTSDLAALQTLTRFRMGNESVTKLIETAALIENFSDARDGSGESVEALGVGRFYVRPTFYKEQLDLADIVDSIDSSSRVEDIQNAIVNKIRDYAFKLYTLSEYPAAQSAIDGGISRVPTVIVATDPMIYRYLMITGDLRTLSNFEVRIVSHLDVRLRGKVFITFGVFDENRNTVPHPLNFGNLAWMPEVVLTAAITRDGQFSKETVVQPRYLYVSHLPVMAVLEFSGAVEAGVFSEVLNKIPINTHNV